MSSTCQNVSRSSISRIMACCETVLSNITAHHNLIYGFSLSKGFADTNRGPNLVFADYEALGIVRGIASVFQSMVPVPALGGVSNFGDCYCYLATLHQSLVATQAVVNSRPKNLTPAEVEKLKGLVKQLEAKVASLSPKTDKQVDSKDEITLADIKDSVSSLASQLTLADGTLRTIASLMRKLVANFPSRPQRRNFNDDNSGFDQVRSVANELRQLSLCQGSGFTMAYHEFVTGNLCLDTFEDLFVPLVREEPGLAPYLRRFRHCYAHLHQVDVEPGFSDFLGIVQLASVEFATKRMSFPSGIEALGGVSVAQSDVVSIPDLNSEGHVVNLANPREREEADNVSPEELEFVTSDRVAELWKLAGASSWRELHERLSLKWEAISDLMKASVPKLLSFKDFLNENIFDSVEAFTSGTYAECDLEIIAAALRFVEQIENEALTIEDLVKFDSSAYPSKDLSTDSWANEKFSILLPLTKDELAGFFPPTSIGQAGGVCEHCHGVRIFGDSDEEYPKDPELANSIWLSLGVNSWYEIHRFAEKFDDELVLKLARLEVHKIFANKQFFGPKLLICADAILLDNALESDLPKVVAMLRFLEQLEDDHVSEEEVVKSCDDKYRAVFDAYIDEVSWVTERLKFGIPLFKEEVSSLLDSQAQADDKVEEELQSGNGEIIPRDCFNLFRDCFPADAISHCENKFDGAECDESIANGVLLTIADFVKTGIEPADLCTYRAPEYDILKKLVAHERFEVIFKRIASGFPVTKSECSALMQSAVVEGSLSIAQADVSPQDLPSNEELPLGPTTSKSDLLVDFSDAYTLREVVERPQNLNPNARVVFASNFSIPLTVVRGSVLNNYHMVSLNVSSGPIVRHFWQYGLVPGGFRVTIKCSLSPLCGIALMVCYIEEGIEPGAKQLPVLSYHKCQHRIWNPACESIVDFEFNPYGCSTSFHPAFAGKRPGVVVLMAASSWYSPPSSEVRGVWNIMYEPTVSKIDIMRPLSLNSLPIGRHLSIVTFQCGDSSAVRRFELSPAKAFVGTTGVGTSLWESLLCMYQYWKADVYLEVVRASSPMVTGTFAMAVLPCTRATTDGATDLQSVPRVEFSIDPKKSKCVVCLPKHLFQPHAPGERFCIIAPKIEQVSYTLAVWCLDSVTSPQNDPYVLFVNLVGLKSLELSGRSSGYPLVPSRAYKTSRAWVDWSVGPVVVNKDDYILGPDIDDFSYAQAGEFFHKVMHWKVNDKDDKISSVSMSLPNPGFETKNATQEDVIIVHSPLSNVLNCSSWLKGTLYFKVVWSPREGISNGDFKGSIRVIGAGDTSHSLPFCEHSSSSRSGSIVDSYNVMGPVDGFYDSTKSHSGIKDSAWVHIQLTNAREFKNVTLYIGIDDQFEIAGAGKYVWVNADKTMGSNAIYLDSFGQSQQMAIEKLKQYLQIREQMQKSLELNVQHSVTSVQSENQIQGPAPTPKESTAQGFCRNPRVRIFKKQEQVPEDSSIAQSGLSDSDMQRLMAMLKDERTKNSEIGPNAGVSANLGVTGPMGLGVSAGVGGGISRGGQTSDAASSFSAVDYEKMSSYLRGAGVSQDGRGDIAGGSFGAGVRAGDMASGRCVSARDYDQERGLVVQSTGSRVRTDKKKNFRVGRQKLDTTRPTVHAAMRVNNLPILVYSNSPSAVKQVSEHLISNGLLGKDNENFFLFSNFKEINGGRDWSTQVAILDFHPSFFAKELLDVSYPRDGIPKIMGEVRDDENFVVVVAIPDGPKAYINKKVVDVKWDLITDKLNEAAEVANFD